MATFPTLNLPQVQTAPLPGAGIGAHPTPAAFGFGAAQGAENLASDVGQVKLKEKAKADSMAVTAALVNAQAARDDSLTNYTAMRGHDAIAAADKTGTDLRNRLVEIRNGLTSKDQQDAYDGDAAKIYENHQASVKQHEVNQWIWLEDTNNKAAHAQSVRSASTAVLNGEVRWIDGGPRYQSQLLTGGIDDIKALAVKNNHSFWQRMAKYYGLDPNEAEQDADRTSLSEINAAVMDSLTSKGDDQTAKAYFDENKQDFTPTELAQQQARLQPFVFAGDVQRESAGIVGKTLDLGEASLAAQGVTFALPEGAVGPELPAPRTLTQMRDDAIKQTESIEDPKLRSAVQTKINEQFVAAKQTIDRGQQDAFDAIDAQIVDGRPTAILEKAIAAAPVDGSKRRTLLNNLQTRDEGGYTITDPDVYDALMTEMVDKPETFTKLDLRTYKLSRADRSYMTGKQDSMEKADAKPLGILSPEEIVNQAATNLYPGIKQGTERGAYKASANEAIVAFEEIHKRKPDYKETGAITDALTATHVGPPQSTWGMDWLNPDDDIPQAEVGQIIAALIRHKRPVTDEEIRSWYATVNGTGN